MENINWNRSQKHHGLTNVVFLRLRIFFFFLKYTKEEMY